MQEAFDAILSELGELVGCELSEGANGACLLQLEEECKLQLEWDASLMRLHVFAKLGQPLGNLNAKRALLLSALKANGSEGRSGPILTFSDIHKELMLYQPIVVGGLEIEQLADQLAKFGSEALIWIEALRSGRPPRDFAIEGGGSNLFEALKWKT